jgi:hypothetical protein
MVRFKYKLVVLDPKERTHASPSIRIDFDLFLNDISDNGYLMWYISITSWLFKKFNHSLWVIASETNPIAIKHHFCLGFEVLEFGMFVKCFELGLFHYIFQLVIGEIIQT